MSKLRFCRANLSSRVVVFALLVTHALLLTYSLRLHFAMRNEVAHVPAGLAVWETSTFSLYRVKGEGREAKKQEIFSTQQFTNNKVKAQ